MDAAVGSRTSRRPSQVKPNHGSELESSNNQLKGKKVHGQQKAATAEVRRGLFRKGGVQRWMKFRSFSVYYCGLRLAPLLNSRFLGKYRRTELLCFAVAALPALSTLCRLEIAANKKVKARNPRRRRCERRRCHPPSFRFPVRFT